MNTYINYLLEANLCLLLFYGAYVLLLRKETNFTFKRNYLLFTVLSSLLFPLVTIGARNSIIPSLGDSMPSFLLPEIVIGGGNAEVEIITSPTFNIWKIIFFVYAIGAISFSIKTIIQLFKLSRIIKRSTLTTSSGSYKIYETNESIPTFSFFKWIIIGESNQLEIEDKQQIIRHEIEHIKNLHSIDILMVELTRILFWFNPFIYPLKKTISDIHEYQADEKTVREMDVQNYCSLLARITLQSAGFTLANHFNKSITVKRIEMMKSMKRKMKKWKIGVVAMLASGLFFTIACQDQIATELNDIAKESTMAVDIPANVQKKLDAMKAANPDSEYLVVEVTNEDERQNFDALVKQHGGHGNIKTIEVIKEKYENEEERGFIIMEMEDGNNELAEMTKMEGDVFTIVEVKAEPLEGMEKLYSYIGQNMKYPVEAKNNNISGKVFVEFIIEKDGSISGVKAVKGIGYGCDEEAVRVISSMPNWKPGKQRGENVRQRMILPISFSLGNNNNVADNIDAIVIEKEFKIEALRKVMDNGMVKVNGKIVDENNLPLPRVNIIIEGTTEGTISDGNGNFEIILPDDNKNLVFSHVSYGNKTVVMK